MTGRRIQRGSVSIYLVLAMVVLTGSLALTVDTGFVWQAYGQLQFAADAAALAAAAELMDPTVLYAQDPSPEVQSVLREQRIAAARQQALTLAALNSADGSPVRLDANPANRIEGDVVLGWVESADSSGQLVPWPAVEEVNSVLIHARRSRAGGDPVAFRFARALGLDGADVEPTARASLDQRVCGVRPAGHVRVPLMPLAILTPNGTTGEDFWRSLPGEDRYTVQTRSGQVQRSPDGIPEYALVFDPQSTGTSASVRLARFSTADPASPGAASVAERILRGYTAADLAYFDGQLALDPQGLLLVPGASAAETADAPPLQTLLAVRGQPRIWLLGTELPSATEVPVLAVGDFLAACVVDVDEDVDGRLTIHLQPCLLQTATALVRAGQQRNPWIGKLVLNR